ncbi:hypothetical protein WEI85_01170 [Actinomycetes bacterium KLBMP 9797]
MSIHGRAHRLNRANAERLLRGGSDAHEAGHPRLADLLAAAAAPHPGGPVAGESAALAAFRVAQTSPDAQKRRQSMLKTALAKLITVKVAAVFAGVVGVGGVAVAATSGTVPGPLKFGGPAKTASPHPTKTKPTGTPSARPDHSAGPPPGLVWLCHDYIGRDRDHRREALDDQRFDELNSRVGGKDRDKADRFCDDLLARWPSATPKERPTGAPGTPSPKPSGQPGGERPGGDKGGAHPDGSRSPLPDPSVSVSSPGRSR